MKETFEYLRYLIPIITFLLGIWAAPFIESRKENAKAKKILGVLIIEIEDELSELSGRLIKISGVLCNLISLKSGQPKICFPWKYVPRNTILYFLKSSMEVSFKLLNKKQRDAIKSLFVQIEAIDKYLKDIKDAKISGDTLEETINNYKRYLYTGSCMLNTMRIIVKKPNAKFSTEDKEIINNIFNELNISLSADDLMIKRTVKLETIG